MRRKYLLVILLLVVVSAALLLLRRERVPDPLTFLPADTLALVDLQEPAAIYGSFRDSRLGQRLAGVAWQEMLVEFGAEAEAAAMAQADVDAALAFLDSPIFGELSGRRAVLALLPGPAVLPGAEAADPLASLVLITQPRHGTDVLRLLAPLLAGEEGPGEQSYQGWPLRRLDLADGRILWLAVGNGLLVASFARERVKDCLNLAQQEQEDGDRLSGNSVYLALRQRAAAKDQGFVYGDLQALSRLPLADAGVLLDGQSPWSGENRLQQGAFFCGSDADLLRCTTILRVNPETAAGPPTPANDIFLAGLPADPLLHFWTNLVDWQGGAALLRDHPETRAAVAEVEQWLNRKCGTGFAELLSLFDGPVSCTVTGVRGKGFFPLPRLSCRFGVRHAARLQQVLAELFADKKPVTGEAAGIKTYSFLLAGGLLQPAWGFRDGYLHIADSPEQLGQSLGRPAHALAATPGFRQVDVGLAEPSSMVSYVNFPHLVEGLEQMTAWLTTLVAMTDQQRGRRTLALRNKLVVPILDGLRMYAAAASRLVVSPGEIVMESALLRAEENKGK